MSKYDIRPQFKCQNRIFMSKYSIHPKLNINTNTIFGISSNVKYKYKCRIIIFGLSSSVKMGY